MAVYVANTGYGVGDTSSVAYSERLMGLYAKLLDGSLSVGQALAYAKQAYYGSLGAVGVYDFKILQETAFYGLPFWKLATATPPAPPAAPTPPGVYGPDTIAGLTSRTFSLTPDLQESPSSALGRYWYVNGFDPQVTQYRPIAPRMTVPLATTGAVAHGALITTLATHDVPLNPIVSTPTIDLSTSTPEAPVGATAWPARSATVTTYQAPFGTAQDLVLVPGQFMGSATSTTGVQRLFDTLGVKVLYAPAGNSDFDAPTISSTRGDPVGANVTFTVKTSDLAGPVKQVLVLFHDFDGSWKPVQLDPLSGDTWTKSFIASQAFGAGDEAEYTVQVVDAAGNVAAVSNKALNYAARIQDLTAPVITAAISPAPNAAGWVKGASATVTFTCSDGGSGLAAGACPGPQVVSADGETVVQGSVTDIATNAASTSILVKLDGTAPTITATVVPGGWSNAASATVSFSCSDETSGLDSDCPADVPVTAEGTTAISATIHDVAGNASSATATVQLDRTNPTISASAVPAPNGPGWNKANVTVSFACQDAPAATASGFAASGCPVDQQVTTEGTTSVAGTATDRAGNTANTSLTVKLDKHAPTVAVTGSGTTQACVTTDLISGVATSATGSSVTVRVNGIPKTTFTCSAATDRADNVTPAASTAAYVAPITFGGFLAPVDNAPIVNTGNAGRTYPIKFKLTGIDGLPITVLPAVTSTTYTVGASCTGTGSALETEAPGNSVLTFDATTNTFQYNWKTPSAKGCYQFRLGLADGTTKTAIFNLK